MTNKIYFATTNVGKLDEARSILGIDVQGTPLDIPEIQSLDPIEVAQEKAAAYFTKLQKPILVEDVALTFNALNRLPGTYINDFSKSLGNEGLVKLLEGQDDRTAVAQTTLVYYDEAQTPRVFVGEVLGTIASVPVGERGFGWDPIFIPRGEERTFGQMELDEKNKYSMRAQALGKFKDWLQGI